jgi:hypothetical protein
VSYARCSCDFRICKAFLPWLLHGYSTLLIDIHIFLVNALACLYVYCHSVNKNGRSHLQLYLSVLIFNWHSGRREMILIQRLKIRSRALSVFQYFLSLDTTKILN